MSQFQSEDIAIIGIGLRFPGDATDPESFCTLLRQGKSALRETPADRYNLNAFYHPNQERLGAVNVRSAHYLKGDIAAFDASFFSITPNEAVYMDPQQRGLLETVYHALENSGIPLDEAMGSPTSVYIGCFTREYDSVLCRDPEIDLKYIATGTGSALLSNRVSWFYDFRGPSLTLDSACSSSLNAVHLGCQGLKSGEVSMAVVGGCNLFYNPDTMIPLTSLGFLSPDGKCHTFDSGANGYSRGEGFGIVILKRVSDAIRDRNAIRAVIRATSSNQDGKSPGITQPTQKGQVALIREAYRTGNIDPKITRYFEAHGTGTAMGDPIEASAISEVFTPWRSPQDPMYIGALKSNIGHLEGAAGIAGLIKAISVLESGIIPMNLWFKEANPKIPVDKWHLEFPVMPTAWPQEGLRRASVNSFGYGGSNAHVVLDDAYHYMLNQNLTGHHRTVPNPKALDSATPVTSGDADRVESGPSSPQTNGIQNASADEIVNECNPLVVADSTNGHQILTVSSSPGVACTNIQSYYLPAETSRNRVFVLSSKDEDGIKRIVQSYYKHLERKSPFIRPQAEDSYLTDLSHTLSSNRSHFHWRCGVIASTVNSLKVALASAPAAVRSDPSGGLGLIFTGQGAQWPAMGRELIKFPVVRDSIKKADQYLKKLGCLWSFYERFQHDEQSLVHDAAYSQPMCTILQVALVELLRSWAITFGAVVGHSSGEIAAAFATRAISRQSAWRIAYYRGKLCSELESDGAMLAVSIPPHSATEYIDRLSLEDNDFLSIACFNSPKNVTISGNVKSVEALKKLLDEDSIFNRRLKVTSPYHSSYMNKIADSYSHLIGDVESPEKIDSQDPQSPIYYSSLNGDVLSQDMLQVAEYWVKNLVSPVKFSDAVSKMLSGSAKLKASKPTNTESTLRNILEIGPHSALQGPLREIIEKVLGVQDTSYKSMLKRNCNAEETTLEAACWLWCRGQAIDIQAVNSRKCSPSIANLLTDLPPYPFNHSKSFWKESRLSKGYRFRPHPRLELLGAPVPDWNKSNAIWRNWIRLSENPWIRDHRVAGSLLYPAAGMIVMAIEASKQLLNPVKILKGFRMKEVVFKIALRIPASTDGIETHFQVRPYLDSTASISSSWNEFLLCSHDGEDWRDHCRGLIQADYETPYNPIDNGTEDQLFLKQYAQDFQDTEVYCNQTVSSKQLYELLRTSGFDFGATFQTLSDISIDKHQSAIATVKAPDVGSQMPHGYVQNHLIHPTTLDGVIQSAIVALTRGGRGIRDPMVPTSIQHLWISATQNKNTSSLRVSARAERLGLRQSIASVRARELDLEKPAIIIDGLVSTAISSRQQELNTHDVHYHLSFNIDWKPDVTFLNQESVEKIFVSSDEYAMQDPTQLIADVEGICYMYLRRYLKQGVKGEVTEERPWYQQYISWAEHLISRHDRHELYHQPKRNWDQVSEDEEAFRRLEDKLENSSPEAKMSVIVGRALPEILEGKVDPLEIFFTDSLIENVYRHGTGAEICYSYLSSYIDSLAHKHSDLVILEVGAGTGGATKPVLDALTRHGNSGVGAGRFKRYDFTDISPSFFETAKDTFKATAGRMKFQILNIENNPTDQGFELDQYDVIIASNVVHATKNINHSLTNLWKLLKPGGKLVLHELTNPSMVRTGFGFGLLPGWWLSQESHRSWGPLMTVASWKTHLMRSGFTGVDFCFQDYPDEPNRLNSIIVSTREALAQDIRMPPPMVIVLDGKSTFQCKVAKEIRRSVLPLASQQCDILEMHLLNDADLAQKLCVVLLDVEGGSVLLNIDESKLKTIKRITSLPDSIMWLTLGGGPASQNPNGEMVTGLARVVRQENPTTSFVTIAIEKLRSASAVAQTALRIINSTQTARAKDAINRDAADNAFWESDGIIHVSRLVEADYMNEAIAHTTTLPAAQQEAFCASKRALKLVVGSPGLLDTLQFIDVEYEEPVPEGYVEFKIEAAGLNFLDIMIALGQVIGTDLGFEGAGVVTRTGPNSKFRVGDRVCGIAAGTFSTYVRAAEANLVRIPDNANLSSRVAAGLSIVFVTAYCALYDIADIQFGESVLIHAAAGGVGQACIQLAKIRGAEIYATVGSLEKRDLLVKTYGIPRDHIFSSRDLLFTKSITRMTKGRGVDVAVNSLSGDALRATWDCIAPFGRFVEVGKVDIYSAARLNMEKFKNNVRFEFVDISYLAKNKGQKFSAILDDLMRLVIAGDIGQLHPTQAFAFGDMREAFRYMQSGAHSGKIIMEPHADDVVPVVPKTDNSYMFDEDASFVISGGLGGLGRSIARWMASKGAKYLILLSRSGNAKNSSKALIEDLELAGVTVATPQCDVSDIESLRRVLQDCTLKGMPAVKGCIQGSMVLKDGLFENMLVDNYWAAIRPKVQGSWNLHHLLPDNMDFFILLSSISTILGNRGQSNYNIGNSFQDALARHRVLNGLKATALDLGMILSVGYVAETDSDLVTHIRGVGVEPIREEEFHAVLNELCNPSIPLQTVLEAQITLGLQIPETRMVAGGEEPGWMRDPLFKHLHRIRTFEGVIDSNGDSVNYGLLLAGADSFDTTVGIVYSALVEKLVRALNIPVGDINPEKPLHALGVDSLVAVELRNWILKHLDADVAVFDLMEVSTLQALATLIASRSGFVTQDED